MCLTLALTLYKPYFKVKSKDQKLDVRDITDNGAWFM